VRRPSLFRSTRQAGVPNGQGYFLFDEDELPVG
jgi:hypothetical protein